MTNRRNESASPLRIGLVQFKPRKADLEGNLARIRALIAREGPAHDLLVFPETCLTGYFLEGGVAEGALSVEELVAGLGRVEESGAHLVLGFYERWRRGVYNSAVYLEPRGGTFRALHVHRKMFLPTYGIFEEARFTDPGREVAAFETPHGRMGMQDIDVPLLDR
ncbi:MAG: carbon-nitrogen hydrolase family protein [Longimicrobiales bacterium]